MINDVYIDYLNNKFRFYENKGIYYPSVTTINGYCSDNTWLQDWENRIGKEQKEKEQAYSQRRGTLFHELAEYSISNQIFNLDLCKLHVNIDSYSIDEIEGAFKLCKQLWKNDFITSIRKVIASEKPIHCWVDNLGGYGGRFDMIVKDCWGQFILVDFKTSKKPKTDKQISGYYIQLAAYWWAIEQNYNIKISQAIDIICNDQTNESQIFSINDKPTLFYWLNFFAKNIKKFYDEVIPDISIKENNKIFINK